MRMKITNGEYISCDMGVMQYNNRVCIQFLGNGRKVWVTGDRYEMMQAFEDALRKLNPLPLSQRNDDILAMTPADVVAWFRQSSELGHMADEVQKVLGHTGAPVSQNNDLETVRRRLNTSELVTDGAPIRGAQARIARALGIPNAGSHRKRILTVLSQLVEMNSTTTARAVEGSRHAA